MKQKEEEKNNYYIIMKDFYSDIRKMQDFERLTKQEFLKNYPLVSETMYNLTRMKAKYKEVK